MRSLAIMALLMLAACGPQAGQQAGECAASAESTLSFTAPDTANSIKAVAAGPTCDEAMVTWTLNSADGAALWTHESTYNAMVHGGPPPTNAPPAARDEVEAFLQSWIELSLTRAGDLPQWPERATAPGEDGPFDYVSELPREAYERLRAENGPLACFASDATHIKCLAMDDGAPVLMVEYGS